MMENIIEKIDAYGMTTPEKICYIDSENFTYGQLKEYSDKLAVDLVDRNLAIDAPIVVFGGLEFEMLASFLGCVKAGHAYIPIDGHTPEERIEQIVETAKPAAIIGVQEWPEVTTSAPIISNAMLKEIMLAKEKQSPVKENFVKQADNFYMIFTSGTTGAPKGVQISHRNLLSYVNWMLADFQLAENSRYLSQAPYSFDLSVMDVYPALTTGSSLMPLKKSETDDFKILFAKLPTMDVSVWVSTPSFADICLLEPNFNGENLPELSRFLFCGEELTHETAAKLNERFPNAQVYNTYGPTEATVAISQILVDNQVLAKYPRLPIGRVKGDTEVYIMDTETQEILPEGEVGEMVIVGPSVSKGYYHNEEKTTAAFFKYEGQQAYRTGDLGVKENDLLFYKGRIDFQVKLHGFRIELEDIDHNLEQVSYVKDAAVVPKYKDHKVQQLVAYVVPNPHGFEKDRQLTNAIKAELAELVMDYMVPQKWVYVEQLPLTQNGKVDRKGLINEVNNK